MRWVRSDRPVYEVDLGVGNEVVLQQPAGCPPPSQPLRYWWWHRRAPKAMMPAVRLRGLLLDSGDTVIGPRGGRWNPRFDFETRVRHRWPDAPVDLLPVAIAAGDRFMHSHAGTPPYEDYLRVILDELGVGAEMTAAEIRATLMPPLDFHEVVEVFADAIEALDALRARHIPIVVVSNGWAGLDHAYVQLGLRHFFEGFVISEALGCNKPDPRMYAAGSDLLGLAPPECLFVDDDEGHVAAAIDLGYQGCVISRGAAPTATLPSVRSLLELIDRF